VCHIYWYVLIQIDTYMVPVGVYSIYMGVRYIGINGVYRIYPSILLIVFPDVSAHIWSTTQVSTIQFNNNRLLGNIGESMRLELVDNMVEQEDPAGCSEM
jgi:hypothetical protein